MSVVIAFVFSILLAGTLGSEKFLSTVGAESVVPV